MLINLVHPHLKDKRYSKYYNNKKVKVFDNLSEWKNKVKNYNKDYLLCFKLFLIIILP